VFCLSGSDGTELWNFTGMPERASILASASPAVDGDTVVIPYPTGDLVALRASGGQAVWQETLARTAGGSAMGAMSDAGRPVIYGGVVYAAGHGGRMIATTQKSGERLWSLSVASIEQPWVSGDSVFVVSTSGSLLAITRSDGKVRWSTKLGGGSWAGPVLAGSRLWVISSKGTLTSVEPTTGKVAGSQDLGYTVYVAPVVAGGRLFVLTDSARLLAFN
jgi:outer membrane protein assembly factor BamB